MTVTVRHARPEDHPRIVAVMDDWWGGRRLTGLLPPLFLEHFATTSYVAEDGAELAGFLVGFPSTDHPDEAYVHFLGVNPAHRGQGLGARLHDEFAAAMAAYGVRTVRCVTSVRNEASVGFHTAIGFQVDGRTAPSAQDESGHVLMSRTVQVAEPRFTARVDPRPAEAPFPTTAEQTWPVETGTRLPGRWVELTVSDAETDSFALFAALDDDRVWAHVKGRPGDVTGMAHVVRSKLADPTWCPWTVRLRRPVGGLDEGAVVGTTSYLEVVPGDARGEIGSTTYAPAVWGSPVNPECKLLLLEYAFDLLGWGRVQLKTDIRNVRSQQAIARLGARYEGVLRRYQRRADGSVRDSVLFSIVREDWPGVRDGLRARLAADQP